MRMDGVVVSFVMMSSLVESIIASGLVMKGFVEAAKSQSSLVAIAARSSKSCHVQNEKMNRRVN